MNCQFCHLQSEALLHITGPDALQFLQGQTTCDTRHIDESHALPGIFCTPQGRVVCDFLLFQLGENHFGLRLRRTIRVTSAEIFKKYIIFSKADMEDNRDDWEPLAIWGPEASQAIHAVFGEKPKTRFDAIAGPGYTLVQLDESGLHFECYLEQSSAQDTLMQIKAVMQTANESDWQALQIRAGETRIEPETTQQFVPQTLNYDLTGHISFTKGCYTGQEVVARLHYLGKAKRRTYLAQLPAAVACNNGAAVFDASSSKSVGNIINHCIAGPTTHVLVAATSDGVAHGLRLDNSGGTSLVVGQLPYALQAD